MLAGITGVSIGESNYSDAEYKVQKQVIDTFGLSVDDSDTTALKPLFMRDVYDDDIAREDKNTRMKIAMAIDIIQFTEGDFKPMIFLNKGNGKVLIAVKHTNNTITLTKFDISKNVSDLKNGPEIVDKKVKEVKGVKEVAK